MRRRIRVRASALAWSLRRLRDAGMRLPRVRVGEYGLGLDPNNGGLYVKRSDTYLGVILPGTEVWRVTKKATHLDIASVRTLVERFVEVARGAAALAEKDPRCAVCGRPIGKEDRVRGIGNVCWEQGEFATFERRATAGAKRRGKIKTQSRKTTKTRRH